MVLLIFNIKLLDKVGYQNHAKFHIAPELKFYRYTMPILVFLAQHFRKGVLQNMINNDHVTHEDLLHARAREVAFSFS